MLVFLIFATAVDAWINALYHTQLVCEEIFVRELSLFSMCQTYFRQSIMEVNSTVFLVISSEQHLENKCETYAINQMEFTSSSSFVIFSANFT